MASLFEQVGGMDGLKAVLRTFYDHVFSDVMIGFHFIKADKERLIQKEAEFTAQILGATHIPYTGKGMVKAHEYRQAAAKSKAKRTDGAHADK